LTPCVERRCALERRLSLLQLLRRDDVSRALAIATSGVALALVVVAVARVSIVEGADPLFSWILSVAAVLMLLGCGCGALCRLLRLRRLLAEGIRVSGKVLLVDSVSDGGWFTTLLYTMDGRACRVVIGSPSKPRHETGDIVTLLVDPRNASRAIIEAAYAG
jgi:hypothetical protein